MPQRQPKAIDIARMHGTAFAPPDAVPLVEKFRRATAMRRLHLDLHPSGSGVFAAIWLARHASPLPLGDLDISLHRVGRRLLLTAKLL